MSKRKLILIIDNDSIESFKGNQCELNECITESFNNIGSTYITHKKNFITQSPIFITQIPL
jgi:hypothetical protein